MLNIYVEKVNKPFSQQKNPSDCTCVIYVHKQTAVMPTSEGYRCTLKFMSRRMSRIYHSR